MTAPEQTESRKGARLALIGTVLHAALLAFILFYLWRAPSVKQQLDEFGVVLPATTQVILQLSNWFNENKVPVSLALSVLISIDLGLLQSLGKSNRSRQRQCILAIGLLLLVIGIFLAASIELPLMKLREELAR
jgi:type II secretory pathway component PulF